MKTRLRHGHTRSTIIGKEHGVFNRLRSLMVFQKQTPVSLPCSHVLTQSSVQQRLIELEVERKQAAGRAYVNLLPPR